jgi:predicted O-methyltransferase YrrM
MENVNFVNMHRYQSIERIVYQTVKDVKPKVVVELGHGSGALTSAMGLALRDLDIGGKIYSYDINGTTTYRLGNNTVSALQNIQERNLTDIVEFTSGDVLNTWVKNPYSFDLLLIDIDNTWDKIYDIVIASTYINNQVINGAKVLIEGGDPGHPRINHNTLSSFNSIIGREVFTLTHLGGSGRTSISTLEILPQVL